MSLQDLAALHALEMVRTDHLGEVCTYHFQDGSPDRLVQAVVARQPATYFGENPGDTATIQEASVWVPYSETVGITRFRVGDEMTLPIVFGATPTRCRLAEPQSSDMLGFRFRVIA